MPNSSRTRVTALAAAVALLGAALGPLAARPVLQAAESASGRPAPEAAEHGLPGAGDPGAAAQTQRLASSGAAAQTQRLASSGAGLGLNVAAVFDRVRPGERFTYTLTYSNTTAMPIPDTVLTASLSSGQVRADDWHSVPVIPPGTYNYDPVSGVHQWLLGELAPGQAGRIEMYVHVAERPRPAEDLPVMGIGLSGRLSSVTGGVPAAEGLTQAIVLGPILRLEGAGPKEAYPGRPLVYTLTLTSLGQTAQRPDGIAATSVLIADHIPDETTFLSGSGGSLWHEGDRKVEWHLAQPVLPDSGVAVTAALRLDPAAEPGSLVRHGLTDFRVFAPELDPQGVWGQNQSTTRVLHSVEARVDTGRFLGGRHEAYPGETVTYTVLVRNPEPGPLVGATVALTLPLNTGPGTEDEPPSFTFGAVLADTPQPDVDGRRLTWTGLALPAWGELALTFTAAIDRQAYTLNRSGGWHYALSGLAVSHPDTTFGPPLDEALVAVVPVVTLDKSVTPHLTLIRRPVTYTLTVNNRSPYPVSDITVTDTVRAQQPTAPMTFTYLTALGDSIAPDVSGVAPWTWSGLALAPGETRTISFTALADGIPGMQYLSDLDAYTPDTRTPSARNKASVTIDSPLALRTVVAPTDSFLDVPVQYALEVENVDARPYNLSKVEVDLPTGVRRLDGSSGFAAIMAPAFALAPGGTWTGAFDAVAGAGMTCRNLTTSRTISPRAMRAYVDEFPSGYYTNRAGVGPLRLVPNVTTAITATRETALPGDTVTYTLRFTNRSPVPATALAITLKLPVAFEFLGMVTGAAPTVAGDSSIGGTELTWSGVDIPVGSDLRVELTVRAGGRPGRYPASVTEAGAGRTCVEGRSGARVEVLAPGNSFVLLSKSTGEKVLPPGSTVPYSVRITNNDRDPVRLDVVTDTMPVGFRFLRAGTGAGSPPAPEVRGQELLWRDVVVGGKANRAWTYELQAPVLFGGAYVNLLRAHSSAVPITRTASVTVSLVPQVLLSKVAGASDAGPGQIVQYTITVLSNAEERFNKVRITDTLPAPLAYVRTVSTGANLVAVGDGNRTPAWEFDLERHERQIIVFEARVASQPQGGVHYNRLDGFSRDVAIASVDRSAPITITGSIATPTPTRPPASPATPSTPFASRTPTRVAPTPDGTPGATSTSGTLPSATVGVAPVGRLWLPRTLQR